MKINDIIWAFTYLMDGMYPEDITSMTGIPEEQAQKIYDIYCELLNQSVDTTKKSVKQYREALIDLS